VKATSPTSSTPAALTPDGSESRRAVGRIAGLVVGDALAFLIFAGLGRETHHETSGLAALAQVALTATPFALGWFAVSPWVGAFRRARTSTPPAMLRTTVIAWLASWPVTLVLRWAFTSQVPPVSFALVILVANTVFLCAWRGVFALVARWLGGRSRAAR
jgi:hypothetical protein